jgi:hypothetical protein
MSGAPYAPTQEDGAWEAEVQAWGKQPEAPEKRTGQEWLGILHNLVPAEASRPAESIADPCLAPVLSPPASEHNGTPPDGSRDRLPAKAGRKGPGARDLPGVRTLSVIPRLERTYLDFPRIPFGVVTVFTGDSEAGKGAVAVDLAARLTKGERSIDGSDRYAVGDVVIMSAEEDPEHTISRRLDAAGADEARVHVIDEYVTLPSGEARLLRVAEHYGALLLIVDGLYDYLDDGISPISPTHMRKVMHAYQRVAEKTQCAVVLIRHVGQGKRESVMQIGLGTNAVTQVARSELYFTDHPEQPGIRVLSHLKSSNSEKADSLMFSIESVEGENSSFRVDWSHGPTALTAKDLMPGAFKPEANGQAARPEDAFLNAYLQHHGGDAEPWDCIRALQAAGFGRYKGPTGSAVQGLRVRCNIRTVKTGFQGKSRWQKVKPALVC